MEEEVFGVFFEDNGEEYLVAAFETEEEAETFAEDEAASWGGPEGDEYYVEPVARDLVDYSLLERGFAQPIS
jgi:hypothetical protein